MFPLTVFLFVSWWARERAGCLGSLLIMSEKLLRKERKQDSCGVW